jgi:2-octaprenyl-6-methoxyphenol hydroxylase
MPEPAGAARALPVAIVGGGPVGLALALALRQEGVVAIVLDARDRSAASKDPRVLALAHGSRLILETLGVWDRLPATAIESIHVSQRGGFGRTCLTARELDVPALGFVAGAGDLAAVLGDEAERAGIGIRYGCRANAANDAAGAIVLSLDDGSEVKSALVAWAEGGIADVNARVIDYGQSAVICSAQSIERHEMRAFERFTDDGPIAALPHGSGWSIVFTNTTTGATKLLEAGDDEFLAQLQDRFGGRLRFTAVGPRVAYPLLLRWRESPIDPRQVWLGNAAQTLHPVAGQGFNLALRDVADLARHLGRCFAAEGDCGAADTLARYARSRRPDRFGVMRFTDGLVRLFSNDLPPMRWARGAGLLALDLLPPARKLVAKRMMFGARAWP